MSKKSLSKIKWTKKFTALFVTLLVGLTAAVSGAAAALGVSLSDKGGVIDNDNVHYEIGADGSVQPVVDVNGSWNSTTITSTTTYRLTNNTTLNGDIYLSPAASGSYWLTIDLNGYVLNMNGHQIWANSSGQYASSSYISIEDSTPSREHYFTQDSTGRYVLNGTYGSSSAGATRRVNGGIIYGNGSNKAPIVLYYGYAYKETWVRSTNDNGYDDVYNYYNLEYRGRLSAYAELNAGTIVGYSGTKLPVQKEFRGYFKVQDDENNEWVYLNRTGTWDIQLADWGNYYEYDNYTVTGTVSSGYSGTYYQGTDIIGNYYNGDYIAYIDGDDWINDEDEEWTFIVRDNYKAGKVTTGLGLDDYYNFDYLSVASEIQVTYASEDNITSSVDGFNNLEFPMLFNGGNAGIVYNSSTSASGNYARFLKFRGTATITSGTTSLTTGYAYTVSSDITGKTTTINIPANSTVSIDLAGHLIANTSNPVFTIGAGAAVYIYDSNPEGTSHRFSNTNRYYDFSTGTNSIVGGVLSSRGANTIAFNGANAMLVMNGGAVAGGYYGGISSSQSNTLVYLRNVNVVRNDEEGVRLDGANSRLLAYSCNFSGNRKNGILVTQSTSALVLHNCHINNNQRTGLVTYTSAAVLYSRKEYSNPYVYGSFGNYTYNATSIRPQTVRHTAVKNNDANTDQTDSDMGGGIRAYGSLSLYGRSDNWISINGNQTNGNGGGIFMAWGSGSRSLFINYTDIGDNYAYNGDVWWDDDGDDNYDGHDGYGGGIYLSNGVSYTQQNSYIDNNHADEYGGGIYSEASSSCTMTIYSGDFWENSASDGGAIYLSNGMYLNCIGTSGTSIQFYDNTASDDGGAICAIGSTIKMTGFNNSNKNIEIYDNSADYWGGAIDLYGGSLNLNNVKIYRNTAGSEGGAIEGLTASSSVTLVNTEITDNSTTRGTYGGFEAPCNITIGGSTMIKGNTANGKHSDLILGANKYITISSALTANASDPPIGISFNAGGYAFTTNFGRYHTDRTITKYFKNYSTAYEMSTTGSGTATEGYVKKLSAVRPTLANLNEYTGSAQKAINYNSADWNVAYTATLVYTPFGGTATTYNATQTKTYLDNGITDAGTYAFTFTLTSTYTWDNNTTGTYPLTATINKKQIAKPTQANTLTYNASKQAATFTTTGLTYGSHYTATGNEQTNAGTYNATLTMVTSVAKNYRWSGASNTDAATTTVSYSIGKKTIDQKPAQASGNYYYLGVEQSAVFATAPKGYGNEPLYTIAPASGTNAGTYTATATLSDTTNYKWDPSFGATTESGPLTFSWVILATKALITDESTTLAGVKIYNGMSVSDIQKLANGDNGFLKKWWATYDFDLDVPEEDRTVEGTFEIDAILDAAGNTVQRIGSDAKYLAFSFYPTDTTNFAAINGGTDGRKAISNFIQLQVAFHVFEYGADEERKTDKIDVLYGDAKPVTSIYNPELATDLPKGYYMAYTVKDTTTPVITLDATYDGSIIGDDNLIHIDVKLLPDTDTVYTYYFVKQSPDETFIGGDPGLQSYIGLSALEAIQASGSPLIYTNTGTGTTDTDVTSAMISNELRQDNENYLTYLRYCLKYMAVTINGNVVTKDHYGNIDGDGSTIVIVYYKIQKYKVSFEFSGGTLEIDDVTRTEYSLTLPATATIPDIGTPTKAKSEFDGWYADVTFNVPLSSELGTVGEIRSNIYGNEDIVIYAKWVASKAPIQYVYDYVADDDTFGHYTAYSDEMIIVPANNSDIRYSMTAAPVVNVSIGQTGTGINKLNGNPNGIYSDMEGTVTLTDKDNIPTAEGYIFVGWYNNGEKVEFLDKYIDEKLTATNVDGVDVYYLVARWMPASYTVYYNADALIGGAECAQLSAKFTNTASAYGELPTPTRKNYMFAGWYMSLVEGLSPETESEVFQDKNLVTADTYVSLTRDMQLNALWVLNEYQLTYSVELVDKDGARIPFTDYSAVGIKVDGGDRLSPDQLAAMTFKFKQTAVFEPVVTDNRYRVLTLERAVVSLDADNNRIIGDSITVSYPTTMSIGNLYHFTVVIELSDFSITYDLNGGNKDGSMNNVVSKYNYLDVVNEMDLLDVAEAGISRPGYDFVAWEYEEQRFAKISQIYAYNGGTMGPVTVKAIWEACKAEIKLHYKDDNNQWQIVTIESETDANVNISTADIRNENTVERDKKYFVLGWAVTNSEAVSYMLSYTSSVDYSIPVMFTYTVKPAEYGNDLWAVYRLQGEKYISLKMSGPTEFTYDGEEHTLTATPLGFESLTTAGVKYYLTFQWYYNDKQFGTAVLKNSDDYNGEGSIADFLAVSINIKDANQAGAYRCELDVRPLNESTHEHYEGTINVVINKAKIEGLTLEGGEKVYDGNPVNLAVNSSKFDMVNNAVILADGTSAVVTYTYTVDGVEVDQIKAAGVYTVTAHIAVASNGNYEKLDDIIATYTITPATISNSDIQFIITQDGEDVLGDMGEYSFDNIYNGKDFVVSVVINNIIGNDKVEMLVNGGVNNEVGEYEALIAGLIGEDAGNYELMITNNSRLYSIIAKTFNFDDVVFEDETVTYDGTAKTLSVKLNGVEIAEGGKLVLEDGSLTVNYQVSYEPNVVGYSATTALTNGGIEAGVYKVTATFTSDSNSFNKVNPITKTLTVTPADYFDLHSKANFVGEFVSGSREYAENVFTKLMLTGSEFDESQFEVNYAYGSVKGDAVISLAQGNKAEITLFKGVTNAGYYKMTANVLFKSEANKNNFNEIGDIEIYYSIASTTLDHIEVTLVEDIRAYKIGETFDTADIESIVAYYNEEVDNEVSYLKGRDDDRLSNCIFFDIDGDGYKNFEGFTHVGEYEFAVNFLGKYANVTVNVQQDITETTEWQYSEDGENWAAIPADGLEYSEDGYMFRAAYECVNEDGETETRYVEAIVDGETADENGYYVIDAETTITLSVEAQNVLNDDETAILYNLMGFTKQIDILQNTSLQVEWLYDGQVITGGMKTVKWNGTDFFDKLSANVDGTEVVLKTRELIKAGTYEFDASEDPAFDNYKLGNATLTFVIAPFDINKDNISDDPEHPNPGAKYTVEIQYLDETTGEYVTGRVVDYKSGDYTVCVIITDLENGAKYTVVTSGQKLTTVNGNISYVDVDSIRHAGTYKLIYSEGEVDINGLDLTFVVKPVSIKIEWSEENSFEYNGSEHEYTVENIDSLGIGEDGVVIDLGNNVKRNAGTYTAVATVKQEFADDYKIIPGTENHTFSITALEVKLGWEYESKDNKIAYNESIQIPAIVSTNLIPEDGITLKRIYKDANGDQINIFDIVEVGTYTVSITLEGDFEALKNYSYTNLDYTYEIVKADLKIASLYYNEYSGVVDLAYTNTVLRPEKMTATFVGGMKAEGTFAFVMDDSGNLELKEGKIWVSESVPAGSTISVSYTFTPTGESAKCFNVLEGTKTLHIEVAQAAVGTSALHVEYPDSFTQVAVGDTLDFTQFKVFKMYTNSYVDEDGTKHGNFPELDLDKDLDVTVEIDATRLYPRNHKFLAIDLDGAKMKVVTLRISEKGQAGNYTTISITVIVGQPLSMSLSSATPIRDVWYVGETFDYSDAKFNLVVAGEAQPVTLNASEVSCDSEGKIFTEEGNVAVTFSFGTVSCVMTVTVKPQVQFEVRYNKEYYLKYTGEDLAVPQVKIYDEGVEIAQGLVEVNYSIFSEKLTKPVDKIRDLGTYSVTASFTYLSADVKYAEIPDVSYIVYVRDNIYAVEVKMPYNEADFIDGVHTEGYTGNDYRYEIEVTGLADPNGDELDVSAVEVRYTINDAIVDVTSFKITDAGVYNIAAEILYSSENGVQSTIKFVNYIIKVEQAENTIKDFSAPTSVVQGGKLEVSASSAYGDVRYEYYKDGELVENFDIATAEAGDYKVKVIVEETDNWAGASEEKDFTVTLKSVPGNPDNPTDPETGAPKVDIGAGEEGSGDSNRPADYVPGKLPAGTTSDIGTVGDDDLTDMTVKDHDVLEGYDIDLKDKDGNIITEDTLDGWVRVKLLISEEYRKFNNLKVYYISDDPDVEPEDMHAIREGDYMVFYTRHFSRYVIVAPQPGAPAGLIVAVTLMALAAAGLITASIVCGLKKKKEV